MAEMLGDFGCLKDEPFYVSCSSSVSDQTILLSFYIYQGHHNGGPEQLAAQKKRSSLQGVARGHDEHIAE